MPSRAPRRLIGASLAIAVACGAVATGAACGSSYGTAAAPDAVADRVGEDEGGIDAPAGDAPPSPACDPAKVATDPSSCGRCGHSCLGGQCVGGICQPALLATVSGTSAFGPVLDGTRAVFAIEAVDSNQIPKGRLQWCAKSSCTDATVLGADLPSIPTSTLAFASDGVNDYVGVVGTLGGVFRLAQAGTLQPITVTDGTFGNADLLSVRGSDVVFLNAYQNGPVGIYAVASDGVTAPRLIVPVAETDRWLKIATLPDRVYAADFQRIATCSGTSCPALSIYGSPTVVQPDIIGMVSDGTTIFWTTDQQKLFSCAVGDSCAAATQLLDSVSFQNGVPRSLSIHGADLYMTTDAAKVFTCVAATCGQTLRLIATEDAVVGSVIADEEAAYWIGAGKNVEAGATQGFRLMRVAK